MPNDIWMAPEGRLDAIPFKKLHEGEKYTEDELHKLRTYWTEERTRDVAAWIDAGMPANAVPEFVLKLTRRLGPLAQTRCDLRGIDFRGRFPNPRGTESPRPDFWRDHLEHANLAGTHLEHTNLKRAHLEHAILMGAQLEHANLTDAHLEYADLHGAHLDHANLENAHLEHAHLSWAHLEHADLHAVHLEHASLFGVHLEHANLEVAHLEHANLTLAEILETNFTGVYLDDTVLSLLRWQDERRRDPEATMFRFFDIRGVRYSDPLFDRWVKQANFIWRCRETWWNPWASLAKRLRNRKQAPKERGWFSRKLSKWPPPLWLLWKMTCNCGRGFWRWVGWCLGIAIVFGFIFWLGGIVEVPGRHHNELTYFYFSIVTFTTLGFGDVTPTGNAGEIWVMLEVILGYVALGGLISIFTTKLVPPR